VLYLIYAVSLQRLGHVFCAGGAVLGSRTTVTVTIARTGYANGKFGFRGSSSLPVRRGTSATTVELMLERTAGRQGNQIVSAEQLCINGLELDLVSILELISLAGTLRYIEVIQSGLTYGTAKPLCVVCTLWLKNVVSNFCNNLVKY